MSKLLSSAAVALVLSTAAEAATAVVDGQSTLTIVQDLDALNLTVEPVDGAVKEFPQFEQPVFTFPIAGGEVGEGLSGWIVHSGGLVISDGSSDLELGDFTIDFDTGQVFGDVDAVPTGSIADARLFNLSIPSPIPSGGAIEIVDDLTFALTYTDETIGALEAVFGTGLGINTDDQFGSLASNPQAIPVPGAALLLAPVAAIAMMRRRR